jgi:hypothetical protein
MQPLLNATASFAPTSGANLTSDDINYTLGAICAKSSGCDDGAIRTWLAQFYSQCQAELTGSTTYNAQVRELYDILYVINPLKGAVCAINSADQEYCVNELRAIEKASTANSTAASNSTGAANNTLLSNFALSDDFSPVQFAADNLYIAISTSVSLTKRMLNMISRQEAAAQNHFATIITPNTTTYRTTNLPFLFLQPTMAQASLCTPCTREVMVSYIKWESKQPYALGLSQSPILGGQSKLWNAINSTCGAAFVNAITAEVGTFSTTAGTSIGAGVGQMQLPAMVGILGTVILGSVAVLF